MRKHAEPDYTTLYRGSLQTADGHRCLDENTSSLYSDIKLILLFLLLECAGDKCRKKSQ